ncbi:MAG: hypothetical protein KJS79_03670 [Rhodospirillales bacterium]|nr:hypothetical protein [Rhodospirillales bacterium]
MSQEPPADGARDQLIARIDELEAALRPFAMIGNATPSLPSSIFRDAARAMPAAWPPLAVVPPPDNGPAAVAPNEKVLSDTDLSDLVALIVRNRSRDETVAYPEFIEALVEAVGASTCSTGRVIEKPGESGEGAWRFAFRACQGAELHGWPMSMVDGSVSFSRWIDGIAQDGDDAA